MKRRPKHHVDKDDIPRRIHELPPVEADEEFRAQLRSAFVDGRLESPHPSPEVNRRPRVVRWRWITPVAAAALILIAILTLNQPPELRVSAAAGRGDVLIAGTRVGLDDPSGLNANIRPGVEVETPRNGRIDVLAKDVLLFEVAAGTQMSVPNVPGRWFGRTAACSLQTGEMRVKTGRRFPGSELVVYTPEGIVEINGTLLSIQRDSGGTCVCVLEGVAYVGVDRDDMQPVRPGFRKVMLRDGTVDIIPVKPMHRDGVLDFDRRVGGQIDRE